MSSIEVSSSPVNSNFDASLNPAERLEALAIRSSVVSQSELGVSYLRSEDNSADLLFTDLRGERVISVPTQINEDEFGAIISEIIPLDETQHMLFELASAYHQRTPIMFEGGTALGKTLVVKTFSKLLYGATASPPDFYCNGQTDVSELMGKYVPAGLKPEELEQVNEYLKSDAGAVLKAELIKESEGAYMAQELYARAALELNLPLTDKGFEFQLGVLPKAMTGDFDEGGNFLARSDGPGVLLHIEEVGLAAPSVVNSLLKIRGRQGKIAESIQIWEDGGKRVESGKGFFVVFSSNPIGQGFQERFEIDKALARSIVWVNLPDRLSDASLIKASSSIFSYDKIPPQSGTIIDLSLHSELGHALGGAMAKFHKIYEDLTEKGESGRRQKVPSTIDHLWRVARLTQEVQIPTPDYSSVDIIATLRAAVQTTYINSLKDKPDIVRDLSMSSAGKSLGENLLEQFDQIFTNQTTGAVSFRGSEMTLEKKIEALVNEAVSENSGIIKGEKVAMEAVVQGEALVSIKQDLEDLNALLSIEEFRTVFHQITSHLEAEKVAELKEYLDME